MLPRGVISTDGTLVYSNCRLVDQPMALCLWLACFCTGTLLSDSHVERCTNPGGNLIIFTGFYRCSRFSLPAARFLPWGAGGKQTQPKHDKRRKVKTTVTQHVMLCGIDVIHVGSPVANFSRLCPSIFSRGTRKDESDENYEKCAGGVERVTAGVRFCLFARCQVQHSRTLNFSVLSKATAHAEYSSTCVYNRRYEIRLRV